jgi:cysteinyl-tRNA synthetase
MSRAHLGDVFDIHGGGLDLIFPHHENEIAQSRCAHGTDVMARYWMHNGFLQVEGKKMSKSEGNFVTIADVLKDWPGEVARFNMLRTHYRQPIDWKVSALTESASILSEWGEAIADVEPSLPDSDFVDSLRDDLNTHAALARLHQLHKANEATTLKASLALLGVAELAFATNEPVVDRAVVVRLVEDRLLARHQKNWKRSDEIRDELFAMGIAIKDNKDGTTTWEVKR